MQKFGGNVCNASPWLADQFSTLPNCAGNYVVYNTVFSKLVRISNRHVPLHDSGGGRELADALGRSDMNSPSVYQSCEIHGRPFITQVDFKQKRLIDHQGEV